MVLYLYFAIFPFQSFFPAQSADWPQWRYDAGRTANSPEKLNSDLYLQWVRRLPLPKPAWPASQTKLQFDASYEPVVAGKMIFVPSMVHDSVTAYDTETGEEKWCFYAGGPVRFAPIAYRNRVYFVSDDGYLYCLNAADGTLFKGFADNGKFLGGPSTQKIIGSERLVSMWPARGAPVLYDNKIYFAASIWPFMGIFIHCLDADTGRVVWTNSGSGSVYVKHQHDAYAFSGVTPQGYLAATEDKLIVSGGRTVPAVYERKTGRFLYFHPGDRSFGEYVLKKSVGGYKVMTRKGWIFNRITVHSLEDGSARLKLAAMVLRKDTIIGLNKDGELCAWPYEITGKSEKYEKRGVERVRLKFIIKTLWKAKLTPGFQQVFCSSVSRIYGSNAAGSIIAADMGKKAPSGISWKNQINEEPFSMLVADGKLFVTTLEGTLYCFGPKETKPKIFPLRYTKPVITKNPWTEKCRSILDSTKVKEGYCLVLGIGSGQLIKELYRQSDLNIIAVDPDTRKVHSFRNELYKSMNHVEPVVSKEKSRFVKVAWPNEWQVLGPFPKGTPPLPAKVLKTIPKEWTISDQKYTTKSLATVEGALDFSNLYGGYGLKPLSSLGRPGTYPRKHSREILNDAERTAYAFSEINCPTVGRLVVGAGADWRMAWYLDGKLVYSTLTDGNLNISCNAENHVFSMDVSAGKHVVSVMVKSGSRSWVLFSGTGIKYQRLFRRHKRLPHRLTILQGDPFNFKFPPYVANLIVSENIEKAGFDSNRVSGKDFLQVFRPYGGTACFPVSTKIHSDFSEWVGRAEIKNFELSRMRDFTLLKRVGALPDSADWSHQYADTENSVVSKDKLIKAPLGILWFGGPSNEQILPRHSHGPSPHVAGGRLFIEGRNILRALDVYTGRLLWERKLKDLGKYSASSARQPGANEIGSNYVSLPDSVYVIYDRSCLRLDASTGKTLKEFNISTRDGEGRSNWGYIGVRGDFLVAAVRPVWIPLNEKDETVKKIMNARFASGSKRLIVMNRYTGEIIWSRNAEYNFRHNAIVVTKDKIFCIDKFSPMKVAYLRRRGEAMSAKPKLYALDLKTGKVIWETAENVFGTWLCYSEKHDILIQTGTDGSDRAIDEAEKDMAAYRGSDGSKLWKSELLYYLGPYMLHNETIINQRWAASLITGKPKKYNEPLTGRKTGWEYPRGHGCNTAVASEHLILFRAGTAGYYDLKNDGGTGSLGGFRAGCTSNLIPGNGVLSAPDYTRTCICSYSNQTSLAMIHMPEAEMWTSNAIEWKDKRRPIRQIGLNFCAPAGRKSDNATLWLGLKHPSVDRSSQGIIPVEITPDTFERIQYHATRICGGPLPWVTASGIKGATEMAITLSKGAKKSRRYMIRLYFAEIEDIKPGERVFTVSLNGKKVLENFDITKAARGINKGIMKEFRNIQVSDILKISLKPLKGQSLLSGIEIINEAYMSQKK